MSNYPDNFDGAACDELNGEHERDYPVSGDVEEIAFEFALKAATDFSEWLKAHAPKYGHDGLDIMADNKPNRIISLADCLQEIMLDRISTQYRREMEK